MKARVLIVEDEEVVRELFSEYLRGRGMDVVDCATAAEARRVLAAGPYDVLVTDLKLLDAEGLDLVREARAGMAPPACIAMSGYATVEDAVALLTGGGADLLLKPFKLRDGHDAIVRVLAREAEWRDQADRALAGRWLEALALATDRSELTSLFPGLALLVQSAAPNAQATLENGAAVITPMQPRFAAWVQAWRQAWHRLDG